VAIEETLDPTDSRPDVSGESVAISRELQKHLSQALADMRDDYRTPLVLREVQGMTYAEIAELLGWPLGTVQTRIHRGRVELRAGLKKLRGTVRGEP
jgi:RNA polymerase sigma-70 factor (ECF subfamily)